MDALNWEAIGAVADALAAVGVVATLAYLSVQVRENAKHLWSQNVHAQAQQAHQDVALQAQPEVAAAIAKAYHTREALTPRDYVMLESCFISALASLRSDFLHHRKGLVTTTHWEARKRLFAPYLDADYARIFWDRHGRHYEPEMAPEIDALIARGEYRDNVKGLLDAIEQARRT